MCTVQLQRIALVIEYEINATKAGRRQARCNATPYNVEAEASRNQLHDSPIHLPAHVSACCTARVTGSQDRQCSDRTTGNRQT